MPRSRASGTGGHLITRTPVLLFMIALAVLVHAMGHHPRPFHCFLEWPDHCVRAVALDLTACTLHYRQLVLFGAQPDTWLRFTRAEEA